MTTVWPLVNACLNAASGCLVLAGLWQIAHRRIPAHRVCMGSACAVTTVFFISYLLYHARVGSVHFQRTGWVRPVYFTVLISHTVLAAAIVPLVLRTVWLALRNELVRHKRLARLTAPLWLYVSASGIVVYWMLYHY